MKSNLHTIFLRRWGWILIIPFLVAINYAASLLPLRWDLTADKRYTLSSATQQLTRSIQEPITIDVFLKGEFPSGFRKLANATRDFLQLLKEENGRNIQFRFVSPEELQENGQPYSDTLSKMGALPINLTVQKKAGQSTNLLYPYAWVHAGDRQQLVPLFQEARAASARKRSTMPKYYSNINSRAPYKNLRLPHAPPSPTKLVTVNPPATKDTI